jgi:hypothetical protein
LQFHWGKPPPAAEPRTLINMARNEMAAEPGLRQDQKQLRLHERRFVKTFRAAGALRP